jgi:hypothetical protein
MVVHINKVITSEQPDDSIPVLRRGKSWEARTGFEMEELTIADGVRCVGHPDSFRATAESAGGGQYILDGREANGRIFVRPLLVMDGKQSTTGRNWK